MTAALRAASRTTVITALTLAAGAALTLTVLTAPVQAATSIDLQPEDLGRGADVRVAHIADGDFVLGDRTVDVGGGRASVLGQSGKAWLVGTSNEAGSARFRILRVKPDDSVRVIRRGVSYYEMTLSENGRFLAHVGRGTRDAVPVRVFSSRTGDLMAERDFANYPEVVAMAGPEVLVSSWGPENIGVRSWDFETGAIRTISRQPANIVDVGADLLATYTDDPYSGGCVRLSRLSSPTTRLWRSCRERVVAVSPDGDRMATVDLLSDGIGPGKVRERETDGTLLGDYTTGWFGQIAFEDDTDLLLEVFGDTLSSTVRCSEGSCANASDPVKVRQPRIGLVLPAQRTGSVGPRGRARLTP